LEREVVSSYRDLRVWQQAMVLAENCYCLTGDFPKEEKFGMSAQIRRAAVSVPANIAEGHGREQTKSFVQFLRVAQGSLKEVETHLILSQRVGLADRSRIDPLLSECEGLGKMLRTYIRALQRRVAEA
jgi:four helix bundle protein